MLVVGGPIQVHGLTSKRSRTAAVENAHGDVVPGAGDGPGLRDWLADLPRVANAQAAAFDTRASGSHLLTGAASHGIARRLRGHGYKLLETESFVVKSTVGPLPEGELQRAVTRARSSPTRYPPFTTRRLDGVWCVARLPNAGSALRTAELLSAARAS